MSRNNKTVANKRVGKKTSEKKDRIVIPILLSTVLLMLSITFIKDAFVDEHEGLSGFSVLGDFIFFCIGGFVLCLIWVIYYIISNIIDWKNEK